MILYWYMHWFWITYVTIILNVQTSSSLPSDMDSLMMTKRPPGNVSESVNESVIVAENSTLEELFNVTLNRTEAAENLTGFYEEICRNQSELVVEPRNVSEGIVKPFGNLSAAGIAGITLSCALVAAAISILSCVMYKNRSLNRPQVLNDHCSNLDSSGYIDDTSDNSEEMYSLDNDSFLNSLEAMTIQNYWTDTVKHTKL
ncbi:uncharacterized protein [Onthophagus taurus]|uniref:uncharacterized protein isoform X2 n=1 Tax=Onthophagus taurus TaxID=166361 RepID=UPI000C1FE5A5|nr:uncharacterized protein LOC111425377 isoform X2 [Onthophagus taurus]